MYLKEIEISGFKSFADKINLNLNNEITCIVGPNGSGKSNIVDAIRFVLGEQSVKSLRGDALMSDVIFSGSKNRQPMHAASVNLTFDNTDNYLNIPYKTVSVKRRLYKTGDNEYFLNGEKCRLKDIVDLFLDSGMGRDSFNIISQGDISKLLSNSPYDRRLVIEEAAGILKYKKRREEAFRKLDKTNLNLDRVNDIINEVEVRVKPLEEQSKKATLYKELKDELENIEVGLLVAEITNYNQECLINKNKLVDLNNIILSLTKKTTDPIIDELKLKAININKQKEDINQKLLDLSKTKEDVNSKRLLLKERIKFNATDIKNQEKINYLTDKKLELENKVKVLEKDLMTNSMNKTSIENDITNLTNNLDNLNKKNTSYNLSLKEKENEYDRLLNKIEIIKNNIYENSYLNNNVKRVLENSKLKAIDALINLIKINPKYNTVLEVATSSNKNFLVVETKSDASKIIDYLKLNNLGRITFLPLEDIKGKYVDLDTQSKLTDLTGYLGVLSDFLEYDSKYKEIILNQFGNILVVDTKENANYLSKVINNRYRIITLDGEIFHVGGSITGGSLKTGGITLAKQELTDLNLDSNNLKNTIPYLQINSNTDWFEAVNKIEQFNKNLEYEEEMEM